MNLSVTHVAGPVVTIRSINRSIQRCAICGAKLRDNLNEHGPLSQNGEPPEMLVYQEGAMVRLEEIGIGMARAQVIGSFMDNSVPMPDDNCLSLVE